MAKLDARPRPRCSRYGDAGASLEAFDAAIKLDASRPAAWYHRSVARLRLGLLQPALEDLQVTPRPGPRHHQPSSSAI
jgi:hypothetical protein